MIEDKFKVGDKVKVRLAGGGLARGEIRIRSSTRQFLPGNMNHELVEYGVMFERTSKIAYYKESDLLLDTPAWHSTCVCGSEAAHFPKPAPGHASYCNLWVKK